MVIAQEQMIADNYFSNITDMHNYLKERFKDILQELMEVEK